MNKLKQLLGLTIILGTLAALWIIGHPSKANAAAYDYQYIGQSPYPTVNHGEKKQGALTLRNTGTQPWCRVCPNPTRLGTDRPKDRGSGWYDSATWLHPWRIEMQEMVVLPGQDAHFVWDWNPVDWAAGTFNEFFTPVVEGITWMPDRGIYWSITTPADTGIFFYTWYDDDGTHWRWTPYEATVDMPQFGTVADWYDSGNPDTVRQQLRLIEEAGFDIVTIIVNFHFPYIVNNAKLTRDLIDNEFPNLKYSWMVEPGGPGTDHPITQEIYDDLWQYQSDPQFYKWGPEQKPLLNTFYPRVAGSDPRFAVLTWSNSRPWYAEFWSRPTVIRSGFTSMIARYDDRHICTVPGSTRPFCQSHDPEYYGWLFNEQKDFVLANRWQMKLLMFYGWNEHHERANIEPHYGPGEVNELNHAYNWTKGFIGTTWKQ